MVPTKNLHLPSASVKIKSIATAANDLQYTPKEVQGGDQEWGTLCLAGKTGRTGLQTVRYFQEKIV